MCSLRQRRGQAHCQASLPQGCQPQALAALPPWQPEGQPPPPRQPGGQLPPQRVGALGQRRGGPPCSAWGAAAGREAVVGASWTPSRGEKGRSEGARVVFSNKNYFFCPTRRQGHSFSVTTPEASVLKAGWPR